MAYRESMKEKLNKVGTEGKYRAAVMGAAHALFSKKEDKKNKPGVYLVSHACL